MPHGINLLRPDLGESRIGGDADGGAFVSTMKRAFRDDFPGSALGSHWQTVQIGAGMSVSVASSILTISTGTTINQETILRCTIPWTNPFRVWAILQLSQRIANQEFYLEVVDALGTSYARWLFDGATATSHKYGAANTGTTTGDTAGTATTTAAYAVFEIECFPDEIYFHSRLADSIAARAYTFVKTRQIPSPDVPLYLQIRAKNLGTAPASTTNFQIDAIAVQDVFELLAEVTGGRGGQNLSQAIPTYIAGYSTLSVTSTSHARTRRIEYVDTTTNLGAGATYTGTTRDTTSAVEGKGAYILARAYADQAGTLFVEQSRDGTVWRNPATDQVAVAAGETKQLKVDMVARYWRLRYVNGGVAQGAFELISCYVDI